MRVFMVLAEITIRYEFSAHNIWIMDETGTKFFSDQLNIFFLVKDTFFHVKDEFFIAKISFSSQGYIMLCQ
jgi:hypothetical protein